MENVYKRRPFWSSPKSIPGSICNGHERLSLQLSAFAREILDLYQPGVLQASRGRPDGWLCHDCVEDAHQDPDSQKSRHLVPGGQHRSAMPLIPKPRRRSGKKAMPKTEKRQGCEQGMAEMRRQRYRDGYYDQELEGENSDPQARPRVEPVKRSRNRSERFSSHIDAERFFSSSRLAKCGRPRRCRQ
jgi:hypothetical protein